MAGLNILFNIVSQKRIDFFASRLIEAPFDIRINLYFCTFY